VLRKDLEFLAAKIKQNNETSKINLEAGVPQIGLFWFFENKILNMSKPWRELLPNSEGVIDYDDSHYNVWDKFQRVHPRLMRFEYDDIPRGRVVAKKDGPAIEFVAIIPKDLENNAGFKKLLRREFNLPMTVVYETDEHYGSPSDIDWGDEE